MFFIIRTSRILPFYFSYRIDYIMTVLPFSVKVVDFRILGEGTSCRTSIFIPECYSISGFPVNLI